MKESQDLEHQRLATGLNELLLRPFPISRLDADKNGTPALAAELLSYVGSRHAYEAALSSTNTNQAQQRHIVSVVQASGSGKTRLAYPGVEESRLVVLVRVWKQKQAFAPAWAAYEELCRHWASVVPLLLADDRRRVAQAALAAMRLLVACHVSFVERVIKETDVAGQSAPANSRDPHAGKICEAAVRSLRNGRGDDAVADLFRQQLASLLHLEELGVATAAAPGGTSTPAAGGSFARVAMLDRAAVDQFCADADGALRRLLWPKADVVVWYDEAHTLFGTPKLFIPYSAFEKGIAVTASELNDGFYGLTALCSDLTDKYRWLQVLCGTWLEISTRINLPEISPLRGRVTTVFHASRISVDDMLGTLRSHFRMRDITEAALRPRLEQLCGRPIFFFGDFMTSIWAALRYGEHTADVDADGLQTVLLAAADEAILEGRKRMGDIVSSLWWKQPAVLRNGRSSRNLCMELYAAARMNNGLVELGADAGSEALQRGLLALPLAATEQALNTQLAGVHCQLGDEPLTLRAILSAGDIAVLDARNHADADPIYQLLSETMAQGNVAGFGLTTSVKGGVLELAFAWHVVRTVILHSNAPGCAEPTLAAVLQPLAAPNFKLPARADEEYLVAREAVPCPPASRRRTPTDLHLLTTQGRQAVLFGIDKFAGIDVATLTHGKRGVVSALTVQAKTEQRPSFDECLRAASPAWQFTTAEQRVNALSGRAFEGSKARVAFEKLAATRLSGSVFTRAFRVIFSVTGYAADIVDACNLLNELPDGCKSSPIILCQPSAVALGHRLDAQLRSHCSGGAPMSGTRQLAFLLPQTVKAVSTGAIDNNGSDAVKRAIGVPIAPAIEGSGSSYK